MVHCLAVLLVVLLVFMAWCFVARGGLMVECARGGARGPQCPCCGVPAHRCYCARDCRCRLAGPCPYVA